MKGHPNRWIQGAAPGLKARLVGASRHGVWRRLCAPVRRRRSHPGQKRNSGISGACGARWPDNTLLNLVGARRSHVRL